MNNSGNIPRDKKSINVLVLGAGILGLTSAIRICQTLRREQPHVQVNVCVVASGVDLETTSSGAGAIWYPMVARPAHKLARWSKATYLEYERQMEELGPRLAESIGLAMRIGFMFNEGGDVEAGKPDWLHHYLQSGDSSDERFVKEKLGFDAVTRESGDVHSRMLNRGEGYTHLYRVRAPSADMPKYLKYLRCEVLERQLGGKFIKLDQPLRDVEWDLVHNVIANRRKYKLFPDSNQVDLMVNCTGLGSRELFRDEDMVPIRGQVFLVHAPWIENFFFDVEKDGVEAYVIPRTRGIVIMGGTFDYGEGERVFDEHRGRTILERCIRISGTTNTTVEDLKVVGKWVGLRPYRKSGVRLEREDVELNLPSESGAQRVTRIPIIHSYGVGGCGMTVAWGMADDVAAIALSTVAQGETAAPSMSRSKL